MLGGPAARVHAQNAPHLYVKAGATGTQTGASWTNAFLEIDDAVAAAAARGVAEVWVAAGTYQRPVAMRSNVAVYGGFAGTETSRDPRNPATHPTIIDVSRAQGGDLGGLPAPHAVLFLDVASAALDGFTITGAQATDSADPDGGGLLCRIPDGGEVRVARCVITGNRALGSGGGVRVLSGAVQFTACAITGNTAQGQGGGLALNGLGISVNDCVIRANTAASGGGLAGGGPGVTLRNCEILFNRASGAGGGVATSQTLTLVQCRLLNNQAARGGGAWCPPGAALSAQGCTLANNSADGQGGGLLHEGRHDLQWGWLTECTLSGNHAAQGGGLAALAPLTLHNTLLTGNTADLGGALTVATPSLDLFGCTLSDNAATSGGALFAPAPTQAAVTNCIFSGNSGYAIRLASAATTEGLRLRYNLFAGNLPADYHDGAAAWSGPDQLNRLMPLCFGNFSGDPCFQAAPGGAWSDPPAFDLATSQTTLCDAAAAFTPNALTGGLVTFHPQRCHQALVLGNTATAITMAGDWTESCPAGAPYQLLDYHLGGGSPALGGGFPTLPMTVDIDAETRMTESGWIDSGADESFTAASPAPILDGNPPISQLAPLPPTFRGTTLALSITAADDYGGNLQIHLFYRRDGGPWCEETSCAFLMRSGQTVPCQFDVVAAGGGGDYEFYTLAVDEAGNAEAIPANPDAATRVTVPFPDRCVYVNRLSTGTQTGETWDTAYRRVSDGVAAAQLEGLALVRVAGGKYSDNVELASGIAVEGGYYRLADGALGRDPLGQPSILVGIDQYYDPTLQPSVVRLSGTHDARLDGFVLTGGTSAYGSGLRLIDCDASNVINHCIITANSGWNGAGVSCEGQTGAVLSNCRILGNQASQGGGGLTVTGGAHPRLVNCVLLGNQAPCGGALEVTSGSAPELLHCTLGDNAATTGGAIACRALAGAIPRIAGTILSGNKGVGALAELDADSDPQVEGCLFGGNTGGDYLDEGTTLLSGAAAIDAALPEANGDFSGAAAFPTSPTGTWSAAPTYSTATGRTTLTNSSAAFAPGALVGRLLCADTGQPLAAFVIANTASTVTVFGNLTGFAQKGDPYRFTDPRPATGSAALDRVALAGAPAVDLDGNLRPFDVPGQGNDTPGATFDIGAAEGSPRLMTAGTTSSGTLDFGFQRVNLLPGASRTLTLTNQGSLDLNFGAPALVITGPDAADFTVAAGFATTPLAVGASRSLTVTFLPTAEAPRQARLEVWAAGAAAPLGQVALTGTGIGAPPAIFTQPVAQTVNPGVQVTFTVAATGQPPFTWQWRKGGGALANGGRISGANTATLTITGVQQADEGAYDCVVTNIAGQTVSASATLSVNDPPTIVLQPANQTRDPGETAAFDVVASSSLPLTYAWWRNGVPLANGGAVSGADTPSLRLAAVQQAMGGEYCCLVSNAVGSVTSRQALLNVNGPVFLIIQPASLTVSAGAAVSFRVIANGTEPLTFRWAKDGIPLTDGGSIAGALTSTLTVTNAQPANEGIYSCTVTNIMGPVTSAGARLALFRNTLHIAPDLGAPSPPAGDTVLTSGSLVTALVTSPTLTDTTGTARQVCAGWRGAGAVAASGTAVQTTFRIDRDSTLTWQWKRQFLLDLSAENAAQGAVSATGGAGWRDEGSPITIQATGAPGYRFLEWTGDLAGAANPAALTLSRPLRAQARFVDDIPPTGGILINQGAAGTNTTAATLTLAASDAGTGMGDMRLSNDGTTWGAWTPFAAACAWTLPAGEGPRMVCVQYRDRAGNVSATFSASIMLDVTPPAATVTGPTGTTRNRLLTVTWTAADSSGEGGAIGVAASGIRMVSIYWRFNSGPWQLLGNYNAAATSTLFDTKPAGGSGIFDFDAVATDQAGNASPPPGAPDCSVTVNASGVAAWRSYE